LGVLALAVFALVLPIGSYPLIEPDEGRRAEIGREILVHGDWVVPTLNYQAYHDKPPLFHWLIAVSFWLFGTTETAARLVPAVISLLNVWITYGLGRRLLGQRAALLGAFSLLLMAGFAVTSRLLGMDGLLTLFVTLGMLAAHEALQGERLKWRWWSVAAVCCGLGFLTKGPIAFVLVLPPVWLHARLTTGLVRPTWKDWLGFLTMAAIPTMPWLVLVALRDPMMLYDFVVDHHLHRFVSDFAHDEPVWYYLPILGGACLPFSPMVPYFLTRLFSKRPALMASRSPALGFLVLWSAWCAVFFTISRCKLPLYILPALPALALLTGWLLAQLLGRKSAENQLNFNRRALPWFCMAFCGVGWIVCHLWARKHDLTSTWSWLLPVAALATAAAIGICWGRRRRCDIIAWALCGLCALGMNLEAVHRIMPALAIQKWPFANRPDIAILARDGGVAVACPATGWGSLNFLCRGDFFDTEGATLPGLIQFLRGHRHSLAVLDHSFLYGLRDAALPDLSMEVLQNGDRGFVVYFQNLAPEWKIKSSKDRLVEVSELPR
jgi:dolichol-phosphate mannosyltransferase